MQHEIRFRPHPVGADWYCPREVSGGTLVPGPWGMDDIVSLALWLDGEDPFFEIAHTDTLPAVRLVQPNFVKVVVPGQVFEHVGPELVNLQVRHRNLTTGARNVLLIGRLPLMDSGV